MADWWSADPTERYWCEITDRADVGDDLKCPQGYESGREYWSYSFIKEVLPGDIVYHYSTPRRAFCGVSIAGGPLEERDIVWQAHGTVGRSQTQAPVARPGWWLPLYGYRELPLSLPLRDLHNPVDEAWVRAWIADKDRAWDRVAAPLQRYGERSGGQLRATQGYLTKMPRDFVERWSQLGNGADTLATLEDRLTRLGDSLPKIHTTTSASSPDAAFQPKSDADYVVLIKASEQRRSRKHERLVRDVGEWLQATGHVVSTPHPKDLEVAGSPPTIIEAKIVGDRPAIFAVREATAQLLAYRYFIGPKDAKLCVLLDNPTDPVLIEYVEGHLGMMLAWWNGGGIDGGESARTALSQTR